MLACISEENLFDNHLDINAIAEEEEEEECEGERLLGMLGKGSYSEPDLSRICDDEDVCDECGEDGNGLNGDGGVLLTRQRTWHPQNRSDEAATEAAGRLPVIAEVTSFV